MLLVLFVVVVAWLGLALRESQVLLEHRVDERTASLRDQEKRLDAIVQSAAGGIIVIDARGVVESMNLAAKRMTMFDPIRHEREARAAGANGFGVEQERCEGNDRGDSRFMKRRINLKRKEQNLTQEVYQSKENANKERMNIMKMDNAIVAIYKSHADAETAVKELQHSGFDLRQLSIVGRDYHTDEHVTGYYNAGDRMKYWGKAGAFWGGIWGLLFGSAFFFIPGIGPLVVAGPIVSWIIGALEGAVIVGGLSALGAALFSIGIPKDSILRYERAIKADKFLLIAHGSAEEMAHAREIIGNSHAEEVEHHQGASASPEVSHA
jgi:uncharacterized membrane protein